MASSSLQPKQGKVYKGSGIAKLIMLQTRELCGNVSTSAKGKSNFREEYTKRLVSEPLIWRYSMGGLICALEQVDIIAHMADGEFNTDLLISGGMLGSLGFHVVEKDTERFCYRDRVKPDCEWPLDIKNKDGFAESPGNLWTPGRASISRSPTSCMKKLGKAGQHKIFNDHIENSLTQGNRIASSETCTPSGSLHVLSLSDPLVLDSRFPKLVENVDRITSLNLNIWDAHCSSNGSQALIGTNLGAALVNVETGAQSWVCRCKSHINSVQLDNSENIALCGLQSGAIVSADIRQRPDSNARLTRKRILLHSHKTVESKSSRQDTKERGYQVSGRIYPSGTISTPSPISCLTSLKLYDQYFLASSMDGSTKLYDLRMVQRGAVLSYEGNVMFKDELLHAVDPSENFVMSGGHDRKVRIWSIKSGELLFEELMDSVPYQFCWGKKEDNCSRVRSIYNEHSKFGQAWVGAADSLYHIRW